MKLINSSLQNDISGSENLICKNYKNNQKIQYILEDQYSIYPDTHKQEIVQRLRSKTGWASALFELYLHEIISPLYPKIHKNIPGNKNHPDFYLKTSHQNIIIEALIYPNPCENLEDSGKFETIKQLSKIKAPYGYEISFCIKDHKQVSRRKLLKEVKNWISALPTSKLKFRNRLATQGFIFRANQCTISSRQFPLSYFGSEFKKGKTYEKIKKKGKGYKNINSPLIIAINTTQTDVVIDDYDKEKIAYKVWGNTFHHYKRISGIWIFSDYLPHFGWSGSSLLLNPNANQKLCNFWKQFTIPIHVYEYQNNAWEIKY